MQSTKHNNDARQAAEPMPCDTGPGVADAEKGKPSPPTRRTGTSAPRDHNESNQTPSTKEPPSQEFDVISKALRIRASGEAGDAERRKLLAFEQEARASKETSSDRSHNGGNHRRTTAKNPAEKRITSPHSCATASQNMEEETMDPLDLAKIVEARLKELDASPISKEERTSNFFATTQDLQAASATNGTADSVDETMEPLDLAKIAETRLGLNNHQSENATTPKGGNSQGANSPPPAPTSNANQRPGAYSGAPGTDLQRANTLRFSLVGATANKPLVSRASMPNVHEEEDWQVTAAPGKEYFPTDSNRGLAVANLVDEDDDIAPEDLPQAKSADNAIARSQAQQQERIKQVKIYILLGIIFILAVALILIVTLSARNKRVETVMPTPSPTSVPTAAPTSYSEYWLSVFPESTVSTILEDTESPQSRAFGWLMEEIDILHNLTEGRVLQRFVLATFYFANSEEEWYFSRNWLNHSVHECLWHHAGLTQYYFTFEGSIPFSLDYISPCDQDPAGYIEDGVLHQGDGILKHFWQSFNGLSGSGIPPELYLLTALKSLALDGLDLSSTIPEGIYDLSNLEYLSMVECGLFGSIPEALGSLSNLEVTDLAFNSLTGTIPSSLYSLTNSMKGILLTETQLTGPFPTELGLLTNLHSLALDTSLFTGMIPTELGRLTLLKELLLHSLILSGSIPSELVSLTGMQVLEFDDSGLTGTIPAWFGNLTTMEGLTVEKNSFTGTIPTELGLLTKIVVLWLGVNALSGTIPSEFGACEQLDSFTLEINHLTGTIPTEFGQLAELEQLWLFGNDLTGTVPLELANVPFPAPYGQVLLHGNDLSGIIPESLCSAHNLTFDCGNLLCGCNACNCSDIKTSSILEEENTDEDGQLPSEVNRTEGNQTVP